MKNILILVDFPARLNYFSRSGGDSFTKNGWLCLNEIIDLRHVKNFVLLVANLPNRQATSPGMKMFSYLVDSDGQRQT